MSIILLIFGLISFVGLVVVHEWGHFIMAKRSGVEVEEFGVGFPPKAKTIGRKNGTEYTLNWLPLGGFVRLKGEHDDDKSHGSFGAASLKNKAKIMVAGVGMNLVTAFILFTIIAAIGMPQLVENQFGVSGDTKVTTQKVYVGYVVPGSPAEKAGIQARDQLISIFENPQDVTRITSLSSLTDTTKRLAGKGINISYVRGHEERVASTNLLTAQEVEGSKNTDDPKGYLGIVPSEFVQKRSTWSSPIVAVGTIKQFTILTLKGLGSALSGLIRGNTAQATEQVSGPVGIYVVLKDGSELGISFVLMIIAVISLTLAIMNILPIPALDGGRLFVLLVFRAFRKRLSPKIEDRIHGTGMLVLMTLFVLITIVDVRRFF